MKFIPRELAAECFGTACLIFVGCGSVAIGGYGPTFPMGALPVALSFGFCLTFLIYALGRVSGCHVNPAATLGLWAAGLFPGEKLVGYVLAQGVGGLAGAGLLVVILSGKIGSYDLAAQGLGQNGWGETYLGGYGTAAAFLTEVAATFIFMMAILGAATNEAAKALAGVSIGLALAALILVFVNVTGVSLNPVRSLAPAVFVGGAALGQLWLFILAPSLGALGAGALFRMLRSGSQGPQATTDPVLVS